MDPLATNDDVAHSLALADATALTQGQVARIPALMAKLCGQFRYESGCEFTPGTTEVRLLSVDGRITLPDTLDGVIEERDDQGILISSTPQPGSVNSVKEWEHGCSVPFTVVGQDVIPSQPTVLGPKRVGTGDAFVVNYTHYGAVPDDVKAAIAAAVARYLSIDPKSAVAQSTFLSAEGYHQRMAAWVASSVWLDPADIQLAQRYRAIPSQPIVAKLGRATPHTWEERFSVDGGVVW